MIGCLRTHVRKQPIIALYFEFENELKFNNLGVSKSKAIGHLLLREMIAKLERILQLSGQALKSIKHYTSFCYV